MNILQAKYVKNDRGEKDSVRVSLENEELSVPMDTANRHYAEILKQVADGTITIAEAD